MRREATAATWRGRCRPGQVIEARLADPGGEFEVALCVARGARPGPTLAVLGGVHGDDYEGPTVIADLLAALAPADLAGTLLAVPVANPPVFAGGTRAGRPDGAPSERLAAPDAGVVAMVRRIPRVSAGDGL